MFSDDSSESPSEYSGVDLMASSEGSESEDSIHQSDLEFIDCESDLEIFPPGPEVELMDAHDGVRTRAQFGQDVLNPGLEATPEYEHDELTISDEEEEENSRNIPAATAPPSSQFEDGRDDGSRLGSELGEGRALPSFL